MKNLYIYLFLMVGSLHYKLITCMEKKEDIYSTPVCLDKLINQYYKKHKNIHTKSTIVFEQQTSYNERLIEIWQTALNLIEIKPTLHKLDSQVIIEIEIPNNIIVKFKEFFEPQLRSEILRKIESGDITAPPLKPAPSIPQKSNFLYNCIYGFTLLSAGWFGKEWWDSGGKEVTLTWGSYVAKELSMLVRSYR